MNTINKLPIAAAVLGLAFVFTQSAFKTSSQSTGSYYAYDTQSPNPNNHWVLVDISKKNLMEPGGFQCDLNYDEDICIGEFDTAPLNSTELPSNGIEYGRFTPYEP